MPGVVAAGTARLARMTQKLSGAIVPPVNVMLVLPTPATEPPQSFDKRLSKVNPGNAGTSVVRSSVKATPVAEKLRSKLSMTKSSVTVPPGGAGSSVKDFWIARLVTVTSRVALALPAETKSASRSPDTLSSSPAPVATTSTVTVQVEPVGSTSKPAKRLLPFASMVRLPLPGSAVIVVSGELALTQSVDALLGLATSMPAGRLSVKSRLPTLEALRELSIVNVNVLRLPRETEPGAKLLLNPGRLLSTVRSTGRLDGGSPSSSSYVNVTAGFVWTPGVLAVTLTVTVQLFKAPRLPSLKLMVPPPSGAVTTPFRQVVEALAGVAISISPGTVGNTSVNSNSVTPTGSLFVIVNVIVLILPGPMVLGVKTLLKVGCPKASVASNNEMTATGKCFKTLTPFNFYVSFLDVFCTKFAAARKYTLQNQSNGKICMKDAKTNSTKLKIYSVH